MVPLAIGTQTAGSVIRPAAYCGVVGLKPSFGVIGRSGILRQAPSLDTVGVFANFVRDAALLADALSGFDPEDPASRPVPDPQLLQTAEGEPPLAPLFAFVAPPGWTSAEDQSRAAFAELVETLGAHCAEVSLPAIFSEADLHRERVQYAELAHSYASYERHGLDQLSDGLRRVLVEGKSITATDYFSAIEWQDIYNTVLEEIFTRFDVIVTPATQGPAPSGLASTGSPIFNGLWTFCGVPAMSLPLLASDEGLPIGVQLIGRRGNDGRLLRTARWLVQQLRQQQST